MKTQTQFAIFRLKSLPKQIWNYFCGVNDSRYAEWHRPDSYVLFARLYATIIFLFALIFTFWGQWNVDGVAQELSVNEAIYFSTVTVTTLGYGDILPTTGGQRIAVALEAVIGIATFGWLLVWVGQSISKKQHLEYLQQEQERRDKPLDPMFYSVAQSLTKFLVFYDDIDPRAGRSVTDFENHRFENGLVHVKSTGFDSSKFTKITEEIGRIDDCSKESFWLEETSQCLKDVDLAVAEAPVIDEVDLIREIKCFRSSALHGLELHKRISTIPSVQTVREHALAHEPIILAAEYFRSKLFAKSLGVETYQTYKYVGAQIEEKERREKKARRADALQKLGRTAGYGAKKIYSVIRSTSCKWVGNLTTR